VKQAGFFVFYTKLKKTASRKQFSGKIALRQDLTAFMPEYFTQEGR
jgi:hypothetical protein